MVFCLVDASTYVRTCDNSNHVRVDHKIKMRLYLGMLSSPQLSGNNHKLIMSNKMNILC